MLESSIPSKRYFICFARCVYLMIYLFSIAVASYIMPEEYLHALFSMLIPEKRTLHFGFIQSTSLTKVVIDHETNVLIPFFISC